jgi:hypothetical protein
VEVLRLLKLHSQTIRHFKHIYRPVQTLTNGLRMRLY